MLAGEHLSGPAKAGGDLVGDKKNLIPAADLPQRPDKPRRLGPHPRRSLHQRLNNERRKRALFLSQLFFGLTDRALERFRLAQTFQIAKPVRWVDAQNWKEQGQMKPMLIAPIVSP